jgi:uncharacterized protein YbaP (TraB family)
MARLKNYPASMRVLIVLLNLLVAGPAYSEKLPLWELETNSNRVLVMGSVHFLRASDYPLPAGFDAAYEMADVLVMEIKLDELEPLATQGLLMSMGTSQTGKSLADMIGNDAYREATDRANKVGIPLAMFGQFEPWFAALSISQLRMLQLGFDPSWGIETRLNDRAAQDGKTVIGLETLEQQLGFMDRLDEDTQREFLLQSLDDAASLADEVDVIVSSWRNGDTDTMEELLLQGFAENGPLYDALLVERNRNWVQKIRGFTRESDDYLVIVGAMHLVGDKSVLSMLNDTGIGSRQLRSSDMD